MADKGITLQQEKRLNWAVETLRSILADDKPPVDSQDNDQSWILPLLSRLHAGFFVTDRPHDYVSVINDPDYPKGKHPLQPLMYALYQEAEKITSHLDKNYEGLKARVAGMETALRRSSGYNVTDDFLDGAPAFILSRSDFHGIYQFLSLVQRRLNGEHEGTKYQDVPLIIKDHDNFYRSLIDALGFSNEGLEKSGIYCAERLSRVSAIIKKAWSHDPSQAKIISNAKSNFLISSQNVFISSTRTTRKNHENNAISKSVGIGADVISLHAPIGRPRDPDETSLSYVGNAYEKLDELVAKLRTMRKEELEERLAHYGLTIDEAIVLIDDRGIEFANPNYDISAEDLPCEGKSIIPGKAWPGVELAKLMRAGNVRSNMALIANIAKQHGDDAPRINDISIYISVPLKVLLQDDYLEHVVSVGAVQEEKLIMGHAAQNYRILRTDHFLGPADSDRPKSEIHGYVENQSSMAKALKVLRAISNPQTQIVLNRVAKLGTEFKGNTKDIAPYALQVGTPVSFHTLEHLGRRYKSSTKALLSQSSPSAEFELMSGFDDKTGVSMYDLRREWSLTVRNASTGRPEIRYSALSAFDSWQNNCDVAYFGSIPDVMRRDPSYKIANAFTLFSSIVGKQVFDPAWIFKPLIIDRVKWREEIDLYSFYQQMGLIADEPEYILNMVDGRAKASEVLQSLAQQKAAGELRSPIPPDYPLEVTESMQGMDFDKARALFRVTVYCSASTENKNLLSDAHHLGFLAAKYGFCLKNGGGQRGSMVQTSQGFLDFRQQDHQEDYVPFGRLENIHCWDTVEAEGKFEKGDYVSIEPNIHLRMDSLQDTDAEIVLAGGAGTIQEVFGTIWRRLQTGQTENRPLIFVNSPIEYNGATVNVWDRLLAYIPDAVKAQCNIVVVPDVDSAVQKIIEARTARDMGIIYKKHMRAVNDNALFVQLPSRVGLDCPPHPKSA